MWCSEYRTYKDVWEVQLLNKTLGKVKSPDTEFHRVLIKLRSTQRNKLIRLKSPSPKILEYLKREERQGKLSLNEPQEGLVIRWSYSREDTYTLSLIKKVMKLLTITIKCLKL